MFFQKNLRAVLAVAAVLAIASPTFSQGPVLHQSLFWARYNLRFQVGGPWSAQVDAENRRFFLPKNGQAQFVTNIHFHRRLNERTDLALGIAYSEVHAQNPEKAAAPVTEIRPWQACTANFAAYQKWKFSHRLRLEERFLAPKTVPDGQSRVNFVLRGRYLVQAKRPVGKHLDLFLNDEILVQQGKGIDHFFDQNRAMAGSDWRFSNHFDLELAYIWWWQLRSTGTTVYDRDIFRVTLGQKIGGKKQGK